MGDAEKRHTPYSGKMGSFRKVQVSAQGAVGQLRPAVDEGDVHV